MVCFVKIFTFIYVTDFQSGYNLAEFQNYDNGDFFWGMTKKTAK